MLRINKRTVFIKYFPAFCLAGFVLAGCGAFRPDRPLPLEDQSQVFKAPTMLPTMPISAPVSTPQAAQIKNCTNDLVFLDDLTLPDGTQVDPGTELEKEWKVKNSGTCNWNEDYSVRFVSGSELGAVSPQTLVPARNGAEAVIRITITAPAEPGRYSSTWRAYGGDGQPFGEWFSVEIVVTSP